jgi:hypothetical protein
VYGLGVLLLQLLSRSDDADAVHRLIDRVRTDHDQEQEQQGGDLMIPGVDYVVPADMRRFIRACLTEDAGERAEAEELLEHPFVAVGRGYEKEQFGEWIVDFMKTKTGK